MSSTQNFAECLRYPGIYRISNTISGKFYFGSSKNIHTRFRQHRNKLRQGKHCNPHLQHSWTKHGEDAFAFEAFVFCSNDQMKECEQILLNLHVGEPQCFNISHDAISPQRGKTLSKEHREKISLAMKGRKYSDERRKNVSNSLKGKRHSKARIAAAVAGRKGYRHSEETKAKMSKTQILRLNPRSEDTDE